MNSFSIRKTHRSLISGLRALVVIVLILPVAGSSAADAGPAVIETLDGSGRI